MSDSDKQPNLHKSDLQEIEQHYYRLITRQIERSKLPKAYGWAHKVMILLISRLGKMPLEISYVAEELEVPTRTLQGYLNQEGTSFSTLRDQLRFHFAVQFLIQGARVEDIYSKLDFKDRTGLINAFKRWTSLPPNHFRKLYNVYVRDKS